jgi:hypothetical protein
MLWVLLVAPHGEIQETNSSNKKGFLAEALFYGVNTDRRWHHNYFTMVISSIRCFAPPNFSKMNNV